MRRLANTTRGVMEPDGVPSEAELVRRAKAGEQEAFRILFTRHTEELKSLVDRWLSQVVKRKTSVADVLQEARVVAFRRICDFEHRESGSFRNWLVRIAHLKAREAVRYYVGAAKRAAMREVSRPYRQETGQYAARGPSPSQEAVASEAAAHVRKALGRLSEDHRRILLLTREDGLTLREAAERMGRSREAAKKLYGRAVDRFAQLLGKPPGERHA